MDKLAEIPVGRVGQLDTEWSQLSWVNRRFVGGWRQFKAADPRLYQLLVLGALLAAGIGWLEIGIGVGQALVTLATALVTQAICCKVCRVPFDPRSPFISALSMCLLLRIASPVWAVVATVVAIASKFLVRVDGKHIMNPTNFGLAAVLLVTDQAWVSPGQWGNAAVWAFGLAALGGVVVRRARRSDVTYAFLFAYAALLVVRSVWLGEPLAIPLHRLQNGALLLFAFFMISDPRTTPDRRAARILFATLVAAVALAFQFGLYDTNGLVWSLALCSPVVPVLNRLWPGRQYTWPSSSKENFL